MVDDIYNAAHVFDESLCKFSMELELLVEKEREWYGLVAGSSN